MRTKEEQLQVIFADPVFEAWYLTRPKFVQQMIREYPYDKYKMKEGSPYGINCPGTIVTLESWRELGELGVVVKSGNLLPKGIEHIRWLCEQHGKDFDTMRNSDHFVHVDPKWLEPIDCP